MGRTPWATYLWPGLPLVWKRGAWSALGLAVGFGILVNVTLAGSLVWTDLFPGVVRKAAWLAIVAVWVGAAVVARRQDAKGLGRVDTVSRGDCFGNAIEHYLRGNWFETECLLAGLLRRNPRDGDARLMLATLYRHTGRCDEAANELDRLQHMEEGAKWTVEIDRERRWLADRRQGPAPKPVETTNGD